MFARTLITAALLLAAAPVIAQAPVIPATTVAPAKLAIATRIAGKLLPDGTYRTMMKGVLDQMMGSMIDQVTRLPLRDLASIGGMTPEKTAALGPGTLKEVAAVLDPSFDERMRRTMKVLMTEMTDVVSGMEPQLREGLAVAYANRFTETQLADTERFFNSPSGSAFAAQQMTVMTDPALMQRMQAMMPRIMQAMPAIGQKVQAATADLPQPKKTADLTPAERTKLAGLLGVAPQDVK